MSVPIMKRQKMWVIFCLNLHFRSYIRTEIEKSIEKENGREMENWTRCCTSLPIWIYRQISLTFGEYMSPIPVHLIVASYVRVHVCHLWRWPFYSMNACSLLPPYVCHSKLRCSACFCCTQREKNGNYYDCIEITYVDAMSIFFFVWHMQ